MSLKVRWPVVLLTASIVFLAGTWLSGKRPPVYESSARVEIGKESSGEVVVRPGTEMRSATKNEQRRATHSLQGGEVLLGVIDRLRLAERWDQSSRLEALGKLRKGMTVVPEENGVVRILVRAHSPELAAEIAGAIAEGFLDEEESRVRGQVETRLWKLSEELETRRDTVEKIELRLVAIRQGVEEEGGGSGDERDDLRRRLVEETHLIRSLEAKRQLAVVDLQEVEAPATLLEKPLPSEARLRSNRRAELALYGLAGILFGVVVAGILGIFVTPEVAEDRITKRLGKVLVAAIPVPSLSLLGQRRLPDAVVEPYRALRHRIHRLPAGESILLTFVPDHDEGCTPEIVANLATVTAGAGHTVLVIDGNFRDSRLHELFDAASHPGLSDFLSGELRIEETVIRSRRENLWFLPSGSVPEDASGLLSCKRMRDLTWEMKRRFDYIFVTAPSVRDYADAGTLATYADHTIVVGSSRRHGVSQLVEAKRALEGFGVGVSGVLLGRFVPIRTGSGSSRTAPGSNSKGVDAKN